MHTRYLFLLIAAATGYASAQTSVEAAKSMSATPALVPIRIPISPYTGLEIDQSRLPLATDVDVAWDEIAHRSNMRWDCRAVPSGKFVANSLCVDKPKVDSRWPDKKAPPDWSGTVILD